MKIKNLRPNVIHIKGKPLQPEETAEISEETNEISVLLREKYIGKVE